MLNHDYVVKYFNCREKLIEAIPENARLVLAINQKKGSYEGHAYDNTVLTCFYWFTASNGVRVSAYEFVKLKTSLFNASPCAVGDCVIVSYNRFGSAQDLHVIN